MESNELSNKVMDMYKAGEIEHYRQGHLPLAAAWCRGINLIGCINSLVPSEMELQPGLAVQAMVLDVLTGRNALYHVKQFLEQQDRKLLLGADYAPCLFNDTNLARALDAIAAYGTGKIITELGIQAAKICDLDMSVISYDTTSTSVWGAYEDWDKEDGPLITRGHSKDGHPELKQFMTELLCVDRGVPIFGQTRDGNSSDKTLNNEMLQRIGKLMKQHGLGPGAFIYVADSAMVTKANLKKLSGNRFISRLPANFSVCDELIEKAIAAKAWQELGTQNELPASPKRTAASYKSYETDATIEGTFYRAIVVHSDSHDKRRNKRIDHQLAESQKGLEEWLQKQETVYYCAADAKKAKALFEAMTAPLHHVSCQIESFEQRGRGRPPKDRPAHMQTRYRLICTIKEDSDKVNKLREASGCFVLLTNVPLPEQEDSGLDAAGILRTYKGQYGVENDFAFLKDPLVVNDLFLKTPHRIDALGMVLIVALMITRLMQQHMRKYLHENDMEVEGLKKSIRTKRPTFYAMTWALTGIDVLLIQGERLLRSVLSENQQKYLAALGLDEHVYTDPVSRPKPKSKNNQNTG